MKTFHTAIAIGLALVAGAAFASKPADRVLAWQDKVDASVITQATALGEAEFLVYLADQADVSAADALRTKAEKGAYVYQTLKAKADTTQVGVLQELTTRGLDYESFYIVNVVWAKGGLADIQALAERADVAHLYASGFGQIANPIVESANAPDRKNATRAPEGNLVNVNADDVWLLGYEGQGVVVGSADTGVNWRHETLLNQYRGWNAIDQVATHDYNWFVGGDPNPAACPNEATEPCDDDIYLASGHGTHTTGTMVGDDGGSNLTGMAPKAQWMACRNLDSGVGHVPSYLNCMEFMLAPTDLAGNNPDPSMAPDIVNNSWGCIEACPPPVLKEQLENSVAAGIFYAVSAGNDGDTCSSLAFPLAIYEKAFSVGATDHRTDTIVGFSSRGPVVADVPNPARVGPDISAPGYRIRAANRGGPAAITTDYSTLSGTSMAGPHVAGLAALIISANPDLRGQVAIIEEIIQDTAVAKFTNEGCGDDTPTSRPNNAYGWGRIDALAAVNRATDDSDVDGVADVLDNCTDVVNASQCDTDGDGYGNHCDADFDNNNIVNSLDLSEFRANFGATGETEYDLNCDNIVNSFDTTLLRGMFGQGPGPSEVAN